MSERNLVSCRNISIIAAYVKRQLGSDIALLRDLPYPPEYLLGENNWITLSLYNQIMEQAMDLLKDPEAPYKMGLSARSLESWGVFRFFQQIFVSVILGPIEVYRKVSEYNPHFNQTKEMDILRPAEDFCFLKVKFKNDIDPVDDYYSERFIEGLVASIPEVWKLPPARVDAVMKEYDLKKLLLAQGGLKEADISLRDCSFYIKDREIGQKVRLLPEDGDETRILFGLYCEATEEDMLAEPLVGIRILEDVEVSKGLKLQRGEIYNAPYFLYRVSWEKMSFLKKLHHLLFYSLGSKKAYVKGMEETLSTIRNYVETLEEKVIERTTQLNQAKSEAEYWREKADSLLYTMLPPHIVKKMIRGKIQAEEIEGTVMYTDLADFTSYSKSMPPQMIERQLTAYFTEMSDIITRHGGWVNKFLGDGILVIYGLEGKKGFVEDAGRAAIEMDRAIPKYPWKTRIGIATGTFVVGEFGSDTLRRFDCIGHTMNLGSRLQGLAESGQALVCEHTYEILKKKGFTFSPARTVFAKGIGEVLAYPLLAAPEEPVEKKIKKRPARRASSSRARAA